MFRTATAADTDAVLGVLMGAFGFQADTPKYRHLRRMLQNAPDQWRVMHHDDRIVGTVHIGDKRLQIGCAAILQGDVGEVAVLPSAHGQGLGSQLMADTVAWMKANRYDLSRLGGLVKFYARFGYLRFPRRYMEFLVGREVGAGASRIQLGQIPIDAGLAAKLKPFDPNVHAEDYARLADEFRQRYQGRLVSDRAAQPPGPNDVFFVFEDDGRVLGYAFAYELDREYTEFEARLVIADLAYPRDKPHVLATLVANLNNIAFRKGYPRITARFPFDPQILRALADIPIHFQVNETYGSVAANMLQIVNLGSLLEKLTPELESRLADSAAPDFRGRIEIDIEKDSAALEIADGRIKPAETANADLRLAIPEFEMMQMVLGMLSFAELLEILTPRPTLTPQTASLLCALFPRKPVWSGNWG